MDASQTSSLRNALTSPLRPACVASKSLSGRASSGYRAVTDPVRLGRGFTVYVMVGLSSHTKAALEGFERAMSIAPEVVECHNIAGAFEYLLRVETGDLADFKRFHTDVLGTRSYLSSITSLIVMDSPKDERAV